MDWGVAIGGGLVLSGLLLGTWLRGGAAEQSERRHEAERNLDAMRIAGLEARVADLRASLVAARAQDAARVEERRGLVDALGDGGGPAADRVLLDLDASAGPGAGPSAAAGGAAGGSLA